MDIIDGKIIVNVVPAVIFLVFIVSLFIAMYYFLVSREQEYNSKMRTKGSTIFIAGPYDQSLLTTALAAAQNGIIITDKIGTIVYANRAFCELSGYTEKEVLGKNSRDIVKSSVHGPDFFRQLWKTIGSGNAWRGELINRRKDGSLYTEEQIITPVFDTNGRISHYIAIKHDVTKRRQLEKDLRLSEEKFRKIFLEHNAIMMLINPISGLIIDANHAATKFYGYTREELGAMYIHEINQLDTEKIIEERERNMEYEQSYFVFPHRIKDGSIRIVEVHSSAVSVNNEKLLFSVIHDITERQKLEEKLRHIAITDELTGLSNRRQLLKIGEIEYQRAHRHSQIFCVLMLDIDHFKSINDTKGHVAGDHALRVISKCIKNGLREYDSAGRIGGEEFLIILPNTDFKAGYIVAERIRKKIAETEVRYEESVFSITVSIGITDNTLCKEKGFERIMQKADKELYQAKKNG